MKPRNAARRSAGSGARVLSISLLLTAGFLLTTTTPAWADVRDQAKRIYDRIAGVPPDNDTITRMADLLDNNNQADALRAAMIPIDEAPEFYNVTLKNWAAPWTNRDQSVFVSLNDYIATIVGMVRENMDFREILHADVLCVGSTPGLPPYSRTDNRHYEEMESRGVDLKADLDCSSQTPFTGVPSNATAGVMTTRAAAKAFFIDGTNRVMFRFTMLNHMCHDLEQVKDITRVPDRIRQDVSRSPGGDSRIFMNNCIGCHAGMDPLAGAFAYYDYAYDVDADPDGENGQIVYTDGQVASKYFNNDNNFAPGYITTDDSWLNYWRNGQNELLGWNPPLPDGEITSGNGAKTMGWELASTDAFAQCQVEKVFQTVCLHPPEDDEDRDQIDEMVTSFRNAGHNIKQVFAESALYCKGY